MRFDGKVAFITGGAIGFGRAFARALGREGAAVAIADVDGGAAERTASELGAEGLRAIAVTCDVADEHQVDRAVAETVAALGGIDVLLNNAGRHLSKYAEPFGVLTRAEVRGLFEVNVIGIVNCTLSCAEAMRARGGGVVVNISSIGGFRSTTPYGVSKLAVRGLTIAFATELAGDNIRVNAIAPGLMGTENALADLPPEKVEHYRRELQLVKRLGTMDDIVNAMLFLCSDDASFITGETLRVSGGHPLFV